MKLTKKIEKFLAEKRLSDRGNRAIATKEDMELLHEIINDLLDAKFEEDCDGGRTVEFLLVNRNTHQRLHYSPIPYTFDVFDPKVLFNVVFLADVNSSIAKEELTRQIRHLEDVIK